MGSFGIFLPWIIGLSAMLFFTVAWLLDLRGRQRHLQERLGQLFIDESGQDLSAPLEALMVRLDVSDERVERMRGDVDRLVSRLPGRIQGIGLVRFRAVSDVGGDQSFSLALTDADGSGVVLTSIYASENTRFYAKSLRDWTSSQSLSFEEEEAISIAKSQVGMSSLK